MNRHSEIPALLTDALTGVIPAPSRIGPTDHRQAGKRKTGLPRYPLNMRFLQQEKAVFRRSYANRVHGGKSTVVVSTLALWALLLGGVAAWAQPATGAVADRPAIVAKSPSERIAGIRPEILYRAGLRLVWPYDGLLSGSEDRVKKLFYHQGQIFVLSHNKIIYALNGKNGTIHWTRVLSQYEMDDAPVSFYDDVLVMVFGNTCVEVRAQNGEIIRETEFDFDVMTSAVRSDDRLFVGSRNRRFYAVRRRDGIALWQTVCGGRPTGAVAVQDNRVYFTAQDKTLYVSLTDKRRLLWSAPAVGELCGVLVDGNQCFMPSQDTALYCLEAETGKPLWKVRAGGALTVLPILTAQWVYQPVSYKSLICVNREDGTEVWDLPRGRYFLAQNGSEAYVMTDDSELVRMDNKSGRRDCSIYVQGMDHFAPNREDAMIFMCSQQGHILALEPLDLAPVEPVLDVAEPVGAERADETE